jgi:hypothetical protein
VAKKRWGCRYLQNQERTGPSLSCKDKIQDVGELLGVSFEEVHVREEEKPR